MSLVLAVCLGVLLGGACSTGDDEGPGTDTDGSLDCEALCEEASAPIRLGSWDGRRLRELAENSTMEYGPQGGQHFFVGAEVAVPIEGRLRLEMEFLDSVTGERTGAARWQETVDGCGHVIEAIPVVMLEPIAQSGDLGVRASVGECSWEFNVNDLNVSAPAFVDAGVGSNAADDSGSDDPDDGRLMLEPDGSSDGG